MPAGDHSTYKDYSILIDAGVFGLDSDAVAEVLRSQGIETRRYYSPPVHAMRAYRQPGAEDRASLPVTEWASARVLTLPLWVGMTEAQVNRVVGAIGGIRP